MVNTKTIKFLIQVIILTFVADLVLLFLIPREIVYLIAVCIMVFAVLSFAYIVNKKLFLLFVFLLFISLVVLAIQLDITKLAASAESLLKGVLGK